MKHVRLTTNHGALNGGETASFDDAVADALIKAGKAVLEDIPAAPPATPEALKRKLTDAEVQEVHKALEEIQANADARVTAAEVKAAELQAKLDEALKPAPAPEKSTTSTEATPAVPPAPPATPAQP